MPLTSLWNFPKVWCQMTFGVTISDGESWLFNVRDLESLWKQMSGHIGEEFLEWVKWIPESKQHIFDWISDWIKERKPTREQGPSDCFLGVVDTVWSTWEQDPSDCSLSVVDIVWPTWKQDPSDCFLSVVDTVWPTWEQGPPDCFLSVVDTVWPGTSHPCHHTFATIMD